MYVPGAVVTSVVELTKHFEHKAWNLIAQEKSKVQICHNFLTSHGGRHKRSISTL